MMETVVFALAWIACGVADYGFSLAHFQRKFNCYGIAKSNRRDDVRNCILVAFLGPCALSATFVLGFYKHGWMLFPIPEKEINYGGDV
jgi:hypothetical protein